MLYNLNGFRKITSSFLSYIILDSKCVKRRNAMAT